MSNPKKKTLKKLSLKKGQKSKPLPDLLQGTKHPWEPNDIVTFNVPVDNVVTRLLDLRFHTFSPAQRYALIDAIREKLVEVMSPDFAKKATGGKKK